MPVPPSRGICSALSIHLQHNPRPLYSERKLSTSGVYEGRGFTPLRKEYIAKSMMHPRCLDLEEKLTSFLGLRKHAIEAQTCSEKP